DELKKLKLKYTIPDEELEKLKQKYELSDGELKKSKQDSKYLIWNLLDSNKFIQFIASVIAVLFWFYGSVQFKTANSILIMLSIIGLYESISFMIGINLVIHSRVRGIKKDIAENYRNKKDGEIENGVIGKNKKDFLINLDGVIGKNKKDFLINLEVMINIMSKKKLLDSDLTELNKENIKLCGYLLILIIFSPILFAFGVISYNDQKNLEARRISVDNTEMYIITHSISGSNTYPLAVQSLIV
ncbi:42037_t:CDS:2, partial [Gigaspora margarita]